MWTATVLNSIEGIIAAVAALITAIGGVVLIVRGQRKPKASTAPEIVQGQPIEPEPRWIQDLREDAERADALQERLTKALIRLAANGLPTDDI